MVEILKALNSLVWGIPALVMILGVGCYLSIQTRFAQILMFPKAVRSFLRRFQRNDDTEEALKQRLTAYSAETMPVISYFEKLGYVRHVNANQSIEKVTEDMFKSLEEN